MRDNLSINGCSCSRRDFLRRGLYGLGISAGLPAILEKTSIALAAESLLGDGEAHPDRILVVVELSGGNDGLNTIVPYGDDEYYRMRPRIGIPQNDLLKIDDTFGFHPSLEGFERLYKDGDEWKRTDSFGRDDLPLVAKVADLAHLWIHQSQQV